MLIKRHNKKKQIVISDASEDNSVDGSTTQQGYIARGKTNLGGDFMSAEGTLQRMSTSHQVPVNLAPVNQSLVSQTVVNQSPVNQSLGKISLVSQELVNQSPINQAPVFWYQASDTSHRSSSQQSSKRDYQALGTSHQSLGNEHLITGQPVTDHLAPVYLPGTC